MTSPWISTNTACPITSTGAVQFYSNSSTGTISATDTWNHVTLYGTANNTKIRVVPVPVDNLVPGSNYDLPDGSKLCIDFNGNYEVVDVNARVTYKANTSRAFNQYVSTSDLLEEFIKDLGDIGVKQSEVLSIPIELFINWLVLKAAEADGEPEPAVPKLTAPAKHRCRVCGRFLSNKFKKLKLDFCNASHYKKFTQHEMSHESNYNTGV